MIKKILGNAPFDVASNKKDFLVPEKKNKLTLFFTNDTEYDLPLKLKLGFFTHLKADRTDFEVVVPAMGKTESDICFYTEKDDMMFLANQLVEIKITDGIFESESDYELNFVSEMAYKCGTGMADAFEKTSDVLFSHNGEILVNKDEIISLGIVCEGDTELSLVGGVDCIARAFLDEKELDLQSKFTLHQNLNRLCFEIKQSGRFYFEGDSGEKMLLNTLNPQFFLGGN